MKTENVSKFATQINPEYELQHNDAVNSGNFTPQAPNCDNCAFGNEKCCSAEYHNIKNKPLENETLKIVKLCGFWGHSFNKDGYCIKHKPSQSLNDKVSFDHPEMQKVTPWLWVK